MIRNSYTYAAQEVLAKAIVKPEYQGWTLEAVLAHFGASQELQKMQNLAEASQRKRYLHTIHRLEADNTSAGNSVMINAFCRENYVAPHKHGGTNSVDKNEYFFILAGRLGFIFYNDAGQIIDTAIADEQQPWFHIPPGAWHTVVCLSDHAVTLELKDQAYDPKTDKEFHPSFPQEKYDTVSGTLLPDCLAQLEKNQAVFGIEKINY